MLKIFNLIYFLDFFTFRNVLVLIDLPNYIFFYFIFFSELVITLLISLIFLGSAISSLLGLIFVFVYTAILYLLIGADFLGLILIIIYVGAIIVLFLFVIMLVLDESFQFKFYFICTRIYSIWIYIC
jgi:NADH:ubiquinone oxidoreductase subunit 6 (subunit J)